MDVTVCRTQLLPAICAEPVPHQYGREHGAARQLCGVALGGTRELKSIVSAARTGCAALCIHSPDAAWQRPSCTWRGATRRWAARAIPGPIPEPVLPVRRAGGRGGGGVRGQLTTAEACRRRVGRMGRATLGWLAYVDERYSVDQRRRQRRRARAQLILSETQALKRGG